MIKKFAAVALLSLILSFSNTYSTEAASLSTLQSEATKLIGVPYRTAGTTTNGFDCSGFTQYVMKQAGVSIPRTTSTQYALGKSVSKSDLQVGDLVFFNTSGRGVSHVGISLGGTKFIHSASSKGVSIASINDPYYWGDKYIGAKRVVTDTETAVKAASVVPTATRAEVAQVLAEKLNLTTTATTSSYNDVNTSSNAFKAIQAVNEAGIFTGDAKGNFNPENSLTRAELAKVLVNAFELQPGQGTFKFTDVSSSYWAADSIQILAQHSITLGMGDGTFGISDHLTKTQLDLFISRAAN
jgi:hypothetical protein